MTKISEHDLSKDSLPIQELADEVRTILNNGTFELQVTTASQPAFDAPDNPILVLSIVGGQRRLYVSYLGSWYYASLTLL